MAQRSSGGSSPAASAAVSHVEVSNQAPSASASTCQQVKDGHLWVGVSGNFSYAFQAPLATLTIPTATGCFAKLHRAIACAAHNGLLASMFDVMNTARALPVWGSLKRRTSTPERRSCYHDEHTAIVSALADRDPDTAESAMRTHLRHVSDNLPGRH